jgi:hypothetical protein
MRIPNLYNRSAPCATAGETVWDTDLPRLSRANRPTVDVRVELDAADVEIDNILVSTSLDEARKFERRTTAVKRRFLSDTKRKRAKRALKLEANRKWREALQYDALYERLTSPETLGFLTLAGLLVLRAARRSANSSPSTNSPSTAATAATATAAATVSEAASSSESSKKNQ